MKDESTKNEDNPYVMPIEAYHDAVLSSTCMGGQHGLTKREYFAAMALQGILSSNSYIVSESVVLAVDIADYLIKALNK